MTYTSLPTSNKPNASSSRAQSGISARAGRPLIRSGMQPNTAGQQNSGLNQIIGNKKRNTYSYLLCFSFLLYILMKVMTFTITFHLNAK